MTPEATARRNVRLYYAFAGLMEFGLWYGIWIKFLTVERGLELKYVLLMDLPFWLAVAALEAPFGALADRIGHSRVLAIGAAVYSLTILGFGLTTSYTMLFFDYMLWAVAMACRSGADQALVYDTLKEAGQEGRFAHVAGRGFAAGLAAGTGGVVFGGALAAATSMAFTVQVSMLAPLLACLAALAMVEPAAKREERHYLEQLRLGVAFAWRTPQVRTTMFLSTTLMMAAFAPVVLVQPFLIEHDVATVLSVASLTFSIQVALFEPFLGFISDDVSLRAAFAFVAVVLACAMPPLYLRWRRVYVTAPAPAATGP